MKAGKQRLAQQFNFSYRYIDDVLSRNDSEYLKFIYPCELAIKETSETISSFSYLDLYLYTGNGKLTPNFTTDGKTSTSP